MKPQPLDTINNIIDTIDLSSSQNGGVKEILLQKKGLLRYDTGMGKSFMAATLLRAFANADPSKKHLVFVLHDQLIQIPQQLKSLTGLNVLVTDATSESLSKFYSNFSRAHVMILTYECLRSSELLAFLYAHLLEFMSIIFDEAHVVSNWDNSDTAFALRCISKYIEYKVAMTATPAITEKQQFYRIMNILDRSISHLRDEVDEEKCDKIYQNVNRIDDDIKGNYDAQIVWVTPHKHQLGHINGNLTATTKGFGAYNQVNALISLLKEEPDMPTIVYIHYHETREWVETHLKKAEIAYGVVNGNVTGSNRIQVFEDFKNGMFSVLLTSITTSLDIIADRVIMYEFTPLIKQLIGRPHRGLQPKDLQIRILVTRETEEVDFFLKYIYARSQLFHHLLRIDYTEVLHLGNMLLQERSATE